MELYYRKTGKGFPLIILHGLYGSSDNWLTIARRLSAKYEVIIPDLRNHGRSPHHHAHTYADMCADVAELTDTLRIDRYFLLGHSMGGKVAVHLTAKAPQRVMKLVAVDIAPVNYSSLTDDSPLVLEHLNLMHTLLLTDTASFTHREDIERYWRQSIPDAATRQFLLKNLQRNSPGFSWRIHLQAIACNLPHILNGMDKFYRQEHPVIRTPALFVKGENSPYLPPALFSWIQTVFSDARMTVIPNAGHWLHAEQPELFADEVEKFLE